jgi:ABC-2 type transport system ATP-binding protein
MNTVEIRGLVKTFGPVRAVDGIDFSFREGEVHGFIGPNGSGKTTTMRIIAGVDVPDAGDVLVEGVSVVDYPEKVRRALGFMPDYLDSYPSMLVEEYLDFYARAYGYAPRRRRARMADVVAFVGLGEMLDRPVEGLSKGWKQRLSLARVLLNDPKVLILDEPAAGLDPRARIELRRLVGLLADHGKAVFMSSHILTELSELCRSVTILEKGRIQITGPVGDIQRVVDKGHRVEVHLLEASEAEAARLTRFLSETPGVFGSQRLATGASFAHDGDRAFKAGLLAKLVGASFAVTDFHSATSDLEDAFIALTGASGDEPPDGDE